MLYFISRSCSFIWTSIRSRTKYHVSRLEILIVKAAGLSKTTGLILHSRSYPRGSSSIDWFPNKDALNTRHCSKWPNLVVIDVNNLELKTVRRANLAEEGRQWHGRKIKLNKDSEMVISASRYFSVSLTLQLLKMRYRHHTFFSAIIGFISCIPTTIAAFCLRSQWESMRELACSVALNANSESILFSLLIDYLEI